MKLLVCGEGPNDIGKDEDPSHLGTLQILVAQLLKEDVDVLTFERQRITHLGPRRTSRGFTEKLRLAFREASLRDCDGLIYVVDSDNDLRRDARLKEAREEVADKPNAVGTAIRSIEAWLLADETAVSRAFECTTPATSKSPEDISNPKPVLHQWLYLADRWDHSQAYAELAGEVRIEILGRRCPRGFAPFADEVRALVGSS